MKEVAYEYTCKYYIYVEIFTKLPREKRHCYTFKIFMYMFFGLKKKNTKNNNLTRVSK